MVNGQRSIVKGQRSIVNCQLSIINYQKVNVERINQIIAAKPNLSTALGMEFISTPEDDIALAENVAGVGSSALCADCACVGIEVSGSHVQAVSEGDTVTAYARLQHRGSTLHVWNVDIKNAAGELISTVRVTNYIIKKRS